MAANAAVAHLNGANLTGLQVRSRLADLLALPPAPDLAGVLDLGERVRYLDSIQHLGTARDQLVDGPDGTRIADPVKVADQAVLDWDLVRADGNREFDRITVAMRLPTRPARLAALDRLCAGAEARIRQLPPNPSQLKLMFLPRAVVRLMTSQKLSTLWVGLLVPTLGKMQNIHDRKGQVRRNERLAFALAAHRLDTGRHPDALAALAPKYLPNVPDDVFSGKPLVYQRTAFGYLLYSVGDNGTDDAGRSATDDPRGDDLVIQVPPR